MKKIRKNALCIALSIMLLLSAFSFTGIFAAAAEEETQPQIIPEYANYTLTVGDSDFIKVSVTGSQSLAFKSSAPSVVTVDALGNIYAIAVGSTTVVITSSSGASTSVLVTVKPILVSEIKPYVTKQTLYVGETVTIANSFTPENATYKDVKYATSNSGVIHVDKAGKVVGVKKGVATVTIMPANEKHFTDDFKCPTIDFIVVNPPHFSISVPSVMNVNETAEITISTKTEIGYDAVYKIANPSVIRLNDDGTITSLKEGTTELITTITLADGFEIVNTKEITVDDPNTAPRCSLCDAYEASIGTPMAFVYNIFHTIVHFFETLFA